MKYEIIKGSEKDFEGSSDKCLIIARNLRQGWIKRMAEFVDGAECLGEKSCIHSTCNWEIIAERRPITEPVWSGEGVPCVGQRVMTKSGEGIIDYVGSGVIVYSNDDGQWSVRCDSLDYSLSAIRSPEDVARDEAIEAMRDVGYTLPAAIRFTKEEMAALYDAGYRKLEGK